MTELGGSSAFMPHGVCYLWQPALVWLHLGMSVWRCLKVQSSVLRHHRLWYRTKPLGQHGV
jgi:hypothetical protein